MATFEIIEGAPGQGKSLYTARIVRRLLKRNTKWFQKSGIVRQIASNQVYSDDFTAFASPFLRYWKHPMEVCDLRDCDLIWDEIATELDSRNFASLPDELKRFLSQYRKRGVDIYANTQDFSMVDARARLMVTRVATLHKWMGSPDPSPTKPRIDKVWGIIAVRDVLNYKQSNPERKEYEWMPSFFTIKKEDVEIYDTRQNIDAGLLPDKRLRKQVEYYEEGGVRKFEREKYV